MPTDLVNTGVSKRAKANMVVLSFFYFCFTAALEDGWASVKYELLYEVKKASFFFKFYTGNRRIIFVVEFPNIYSFCLV